MDGTGNVTMHPLGSQYHSPAFPVKVLTHIKPILLRRVSVAFEGRDRHVLICSSPFEMALSESFVSFLRLGHFYSDGKP